MEVVVILAILLVLLGYSVGYLTQEYRYRTIQLRKHKADEALPDKVEVNADEGVLSFRVFDTDKGEFTLTSRMMRDADASILEALRQDLMDEAAARGLMVNIEEETFDGSIIIRWKPDPRAEPLKRDRW